MLRDGAYTNADRWIALLKPTDIAFEARRYLIPLVTQSTSWTAFQSAPIQVDDESWTIEGLVQPEADKRWTMLKFDDFSWTSGQCRVTKSSGKHQAQLGPLSEMPLRALDGLWNLIENLPDQLAFDFNLWRRSRKGAAQRIHAPSRGVQVVGDPKQSWIGRNIRISPQNVIDTTNGPVILDNGVTLESFNRIDGPAYIGQGTTLLGGKYTNGTAIGPGCKIGGEWEASIAQGFVNKAHAGFFGHGMLGEWVNLGAMTTNSDLKNTYGNVRMRRAGMDVDTGQIKVGAFIADHTKTGIGTLVPTGATWGVAVNYFGGDLAPKHMPSFIWGEGDDLVEHHLDKMLKTADATVARRAEVLRMLDHPDHLDEIAKTLLTDIFRTTATERATFLREKGNRSNRSY